MIRDALTFPFRTPGAIATVVVGAVLYIISNFFDRGLINMGASSFFFAYFLLVIGSTMTGHDDVPYWQEYTDFWGTFVLPALRALLVQVIAFGPAIACYLLLKPTEDGEFWRWLVVGGSGLLGAFYVPMGLLGVVAFGSLVGALPHVVLPAIFRTFGSYLLLIFTLLVLMIVLAVPVGLSEEIAYAGRMIEGTLDFIGLLMIGRLLGLFYRRRTEALGWE